MIAVRPAAPSWMSIASWSPELMNRSAAAVGANVAPVASSGDGGACGTPDFVTNAKFAGSTPTELRQAALLFTPAFWSELKLKIAIAAHHFVASQLTPGGQLTQPGG